MVLLTMTPSIVEGLEIRGEAPAAPNESTLESEPEPESTANNEPSLEAPAPGKPISHSQILDLWRHIRDDTDYTLEKLLLGARVYIAPPPPKPEPTPEYKALMARLRRDEEARAYERMLNPPNLHIPLPAGGFDPYSTIHRPAAGDDADDDALAVVTKELNQQMMLVVNVLLSVFGTAGAVWMAARWWGEGSRVLLALGAAIVVGVAEVVIFGVFVGRVREGREGRKGVKEEVREVVGTWVAGGGGKGGEGEASEEDGDEAEIQAVGEDIGGGTILRRRNRPPSRPPS